MGNFAANLGNRLGAIRAAPRGMVPPMDLDNPSTVAPAPGWGMGGLISKMVGGGAPFAKTGGGMPAPPIDEAPAPEVETPRQRAERQRSQRANRGRQEITLPTTPTPVAPAAKPALGIPPRPDITGRARTNRLNMF